MNKSNEKMLGWGDLLDLKRMDIRVLHKTWFAFFLTFFVWFNMAPLATVIAEETGLTMQQMKLLAICNVALTMPGRVIIGMLSDRFGPRKTFTGIMLVLAIPCFAFAFGSSYTQMLVSRLLLSVVGTGFVVGIHMTSLWFKPRDIGFAQGVEAGLGNWGSSIAAIILPVLAINIFHGAWGWRYSIAASGVVMMAFGLYYYFSTTDGPPGTTRHRTRKAAAIEVSTWGSMINAIIWTVPIIGILALLAWRIYDMGFMGMNALIISLAVIGAVVLYQTIQILRVNLPILKKGVPADDRYRFTDVACLCTCYMASFGAELGVISMLPAFFQNTFGLTPQYAGLIGSLFAFMNFFSRSLGGYISDRSSSRRGVMLVYLAGITITFGLMGLISPEWPLWTAVLVTVLCAIFVTGGCGTTYALVPLVKRRITGQVTGYVGAYGSVGATLYLTAYTFMSDSAFFFFIGGTALSTFIFCLFFLKEPKGAFAHEYQLSSVDRELMKSGKF
ncbi:MAG: MFS transporter [Thermodesulfobacteriota bacterium]|nr:MAG: MFS transporter [Thermodesulfobacteriota bacterium]